MAGRRAGLVGVLTAALVLSGVSAQAATEVPEFTVPPASETSIPLPDSAGTVVFPNNAERTAPVHVDVSQKAATAADVGTEAGGGERILGDIVVVAAQDDAGAAVTTFPHEVVLDAGDVNAPTVATTFVPGVELTVAVDKAAVAGLDANDLALYTRSGPGARWVKLPSAYDPAKGVVVGDSDHLSEFAVMAAPDAAAAAPNGAPVVVLDPDNNAGVAQWGGTLVRELPNNIKLTEGVTAALQQQCQAQVVTTRDGATDTVSTAIRAQIAANAAPDLMATLAFNTVGKGAGTPGEPGQAWGTETDGGVRVWADATDAGDLAFGQRFLTTIPQYTGRPAPVAVNAGAAAVPLPYADLAAVATTYAHVETLFLDHNFDYPVIRDRFDLIVDAVTAAMVAQLRSQGFACDGAGTGLPQRPSAAELAQLRTLGWQNSQLYGADPVSFSSGNYVMDEPVFTLTGVGDQVIDLNLTYNSLDPTESVVGRGWSFAYNVAYQAYADGGVLIRFDDGRQLAFEPGPGGTFVTPPGGNSTLTRTGADTVELVTNNTEKYRFRVDAATGYGVLSSTVDRQGNTTTLTWGAPVGVQGLRPLTKIVDEAGQTVTLTATADGRIASATHPDGRVWRFAYVGSRLASITDARDVKRSFAYDAAGRMTSVTAGDGVTYVKNTYDGDGRVTAQTNATGAVRTFEYQDSKTVYTDALGNRTTYVFDDKKRVTQTIDAVGGTASTGYDNDSNPTTRTDEAGRVTTTTYDSQGRPLKVTDALGAVQTMEYNSLGDLVTMTQPDGLGGERTTTFEVNADGRTTKTTFDDGSTQTATFDEHGDRSSVTDQNGHTTRFSLDARGNTVRTTDPLGESASATFDEANRQLTLTDENGHTTRYAYDAADNLVSQTDPLGHVTRYAYDVNSKRTSMTDALGRTTRYTYDDNLNLVGVTHPDGSTEKFALDAEYGVTTSVDGRGGEVRTTFDALLRPVVSIDENGQRWSTTYDAVGNPVSVTDPAGASTSMVYDKLDRVVQRTDQNGAVWKTEYDAAGNRVKDTAPDGTSISATFDALGQMTAAVDEQGNRTTVAYDPAGNVVARTDRRGNTTRTTYDALDRIVAIENPDGGVAKRSYDPAGNLVSATDPRGGTVRTAYDDADRAVRNTDELGAVSTTTFDAVGNPVTRVDAEGATWRMSYDAMNRLASTTSPLGDKDAYAYDANGNLVALTKPDGAVTRRVYDGRDDLVGVVENARDGVPAAGRPGGSADVNVTTRYERNPVGWVVVMVDAKGARTTYDVDGLGQVLKQTDPLGRTTTWTYTSVRTLASRTDGNGKTTTYAYDPDRMLTAATYADGTSTRYGYDQDNFRVSMTDSVGTTSWGRDWRGNETTSTDGAGHTVTHAYDLAGNVTSLGYSAGYASARTYDAANRLATVTDPSGTIRYTRDRIGRATSVTHPGGVVTGLTYDAEGNTTAIEHDGPRSGSNSTSPTATMLHLAYTWTPDNLVASRTASTRNGKDTGKPADPGNNGPDVTTYTYDGVNRLVRSAIAGGHTASYTYDPVGNRTGYTTDDDPQSPSPKDALTATSTYDAADQLLTERRASKNAAKVVTRGYDRNGNLVTAATQRHNPIGKPVGQVETTTYGYNLRDELVSLTDAKGATTWARDGLGRALSTTDTHTPRAGTTGYVYDQAQVIETLQLDGGPGPATIVRGPDQALLSQTLGAGAADQGATGTEALLTDVLGTVFGVARANGTSSKIATYTDFGEYVGNQHPSSVFGFTGEIQDAASSRVDFLARSYEAITGRFLQRDRAGQDLLQPATFHPYLYAFAAPTTYIEYLGNFGFSSITNFVKDNAGAIAGAVVGVAVGAVVTAVAGPVAGAMVGAVVGGMVQRAVEGKTVLDPKAMLTDAAIGLVTGGALGKVARAGVGKVAATKVGQRAAATRSAQALKAAAAKAKTAKAAVQARKAAAAKAARAQASNLRTASTDKIRSGVSLVKGRTVTKPSGRVTAQAERALTPANLRAKLFKETGEEYDRVLSSMSNRERGPVLTGAINKKTGEVSFGLNRADVDPDLNDLLSQRVRRFNDLELEPAAYKGMPGSHSEINALNKGLARDSSAEVHDFAVLNLRIRGARKGEPISSCDNCARLLPDVEDWGSQ